MNRAFWFGALLIFRRRQGLLPESRKKGKIELGWKLTGQIRRNIQNQSKNPKASSMRSDLRSPQFI